MDWEHIAGYAIPGYGAYSMGKDLWNWGKGRPTAPAMGQNPYQGDWSNLIGQLSNQATGNGPSLAEGAYRQANQTGMNNLLSMSRGGSAGAVRQGQIGMGQMNQGLTEGVTQAKLQERLMAQQGLAGALQGAGNAWFQPQQANLNAQLQTPTNLQMLTGFLSQLGAAGGTVAGGRRGGQGQGGQGGY